MILLHVMVVALYGLTAYALWPATAGHGAVGPRGRPRSCRRRRLARADGARAARLDRLARCRHTEGLDLSFVNAMSVVAGLVAAVAWISGLLATLPPSAPSCCR
jgi:hypothetical protein